MEAETTIVPDAYEHLLTHSVNNSGFFLLYQCNERINLASTWSELDWDVVWMLKTIGDIRAIGAVSRESIPKVSDGTFSTTMEVLTLLIWGGTIGVSACYDKGISLRLCVEPRNTEAQKINGQGSGKEKRV